jgi:hypothetical protein
MMLSHLFESSIERAAPTVARNISNRIDNPYYNFRHIQSLRELLITHLGDAAKFLSRTNPRELSFIRVIPFLDRKGKETK